jgi:hypothetical protein
MFIVSGKSGTNSAVDRTPCDRTHLSLILNVCVPVNACYAAACERASLNRKQCSVTLEHTSVVFKCTCRACYIVACMRSILLPTLECTSASYINIPEAVCSFSVSSSFD